MFRKYLHIEKNKIAISSLTFTLHRIFYLNSCKQTMGYLICLNMLYRENFIYTNIITGLVREGNINILKIPLFSLNKENNL